ncbi:5-formyltetrahydrofolate cyclo-ligase [Pontibacillus salicampi]|uniref:5-formyltetrahydrofolate cyclo-ligase n=1 Tax=Pontibacillus salicampi TaxID=1449801 RepID=A0ABV6LJT1_9BACI
MKKRLRKKGIQLLKGMEAIERQELSVSIMDNLFQTSMWKRADVIGTTIPQEHELDTTILIHKAWEEGKKIAVPKCYPERNELLFYTLTSFEQLEIVFYGLKEPKVELTKECSKEAIDLMIVPGLLFDYSGYRIGYGGGYYDRYLSDFPNTTVALAANAQVTENLPFETFDIPVDHLVTEKGKLY